MATKTRLHGKALGISLAESFQSNVMAGNRVDISFEEWIPVVAGGDTRAEVAAMDHYKRLVDERRAEDKHRARHRDNPPRKSGKLDIYNDVLPKLGLPDSGELIERNQNFIYEQAHRPDAGPADDKAAMKREQDIEGDIFSAWKKSVESVFDRIAQETGVVIDTDWSKGTATIEATNGDWDKVARNLIQIIGGVGLFDPGSTLKEAIQQESVRTARQYVQKLWMVVRNYPSVYGGTSYERHYSMVLEDYLRNL